MSLVRNERTELSATLMNGVSIAMVAAGAVAPLVALTYGIPGSVGGRTVALVGLGWLAGGICLHLVARWHLRGLRG